jgi:biotin carboxyl carrier protein
MTQYTYRINGREYEVTINSVSDSNAHVTVNGKDFDVEMVATEQEPTTKSYEPAIRRQDKAGATTPEQPKEKTIKSPLPGTILSIKVKAGDSIKEGQTLAILEAMKMENEIISEHDGTVTSVNVEKGDSVLEGTVILTIK